MINNTILINERDNHPRGNKLRHMQYRMIYRPKTGRHPRFGSRISITYFEFKRLEMHSWPLHAKHPTFEFGQQGDIGGKFKVGAEGDRSTRDERGLGVGGSCI